MAVVRYGSGSSLTLDLPAGALLAYCDAPRGVPLSDVSAAVDRALAAPLGFPPLTRAALPQDKVVLALAPGVPRAATIVERTVRALLACGIAASDITLLRTLSDSEAAASDPLEALSSDVRRSIVSQVHDPRNRDALSYLAASSGGQPIYVHRALHDADLMISIGCLRPTGSPGYHGIGSSVFPTFSDAASIERFHTPRADEPQRCKRLGKQTAEVAWLLGLSFTIQVVPGDAAEVLHVLAGDLDAVHREGTRLCDEAWILPVPRRASFVVSTLGGGARDQTWEDVGRALAAASRVVIGDGAVAICTELEQRPGAALRQIIGADDPREALDELARHPSSDALAAGQLVHALRRGKVYLISRLDDELVEDLGISPLDATQVSRVAGRYDSCIVLTNAQFAMAATCDDAPEPASLERRRLPS